MSNSSPIAQDDLNTVARDATIIGNVITGAPGAGQDTDPDGDSLRVSQILQNGLGGPISAGGQFTLTGTFGTLTIRSTGDFTYIADQQAADNLSFGTTGTDSFTYRVSDRQPGDPDALTDQAFLVFTIPGENRAPAAVDDTFAASPNDTVTGNVRAG